MACVADAQALGYAEADPTADVEGYDAAAKAAILASIAFGFYVANFGKYNETYGSLGAAIAMMMWLWIAAIVVMICFSIALGANPLPWGEVWNGLLARDNSEAAIIVWTLRIPRTVVAIATGAFVANIYYAQPLIASIARSGVSAADR